MAELKCMVEKYKNKGSICYPAECQYCGHELHEAERRKRIIDTYGLTRRRDGLWGLVIRR